MNGLPRLLPEEVLPAYTYVPNSSTPHPVRHPDGHSHGRKARTPRPLDQEKWDENRHFLLAIDLFNYGYYWEAGEEWERLRLASNPESLVGRLLAGLVKLATTGVKVREQSLNDVERQAASAEEVFSYVASESGEDVYCGLTLTQLQFAAFRASQLIYKGKMTAGVPVRVFPFVIEPKTDYLD